MALNKAKIITITGVKGGSGKTTTTLNLAGVCSKLGKKVLLIDLDLYCGDIASILNKKYDNDIYSLFEDINDNRFDKIENYIVNYTDNLDYIPAPKDPRVARKITSKTLNLILYKASMKYDLILIADKSHILFLIVPNFSLDILTSSSLLFNTLKSRNEFSLLL